VDTSGRGGVVEVPVSHKSTEISTRKLWTVVRHHYIPNFVSRELSLDFVNDCGSRRIFDFFHFEEIGIVIHHNYTVG
jgi:hypothetical protein